MAKPGGGGGRGGGLSVAKGDERAFLRRLAVAAKKKSGRAGSIVTASHGMSVYQKSKAMDEYWRGIVAAAKRDGLTADEIDSLARAK